MRDLLLAKSYNLTENSVEFDTSDTLLKEVYDLAEIRCKENIKTFTDYEVLIEGSKYNGVWLETQPLGGEMYAKRNLKVGLNNLLIFMRNQRRDGRFPGMITAPVHWYDGTSCIYDWMQGSFFTKAAFKMYYHLGEDKEYLKLVYDSLKAFDDYLWQARDSDGDGCIESWCIWDTGEDNCTKHILSGMDMRKYGPWGKSEAPQNTEKGRFPHESAEYMSYSYSMRKTLAKISEILNLGETEFWEKQAKKVQDKFIEYLWDDEKKYSFDRDCNNDKMEILLGSEIMKCMYHGIYTQEMADEFIKRHLLNKEEFWTKYPLPSIAANDKYFHVNKEYSNCADEVYAILGYDSDIDDNSWSGPCEGLTYQRSIDAMINYNHHAETVLIGKKLIELIKKNKKFPQQFNPFTGEVPKDAMDGYGPMVLATLEYISFLCGINVTCGNIYWSVGVENDFTYTQNMSGHKFVLSCKSGTSEAYIDEELIFKVSGAVRIKTDMNGNIISIYGIADKQVEICLEYKGKTYIGEIAPNDEVAVIDSELKLVNTIPFDYKPN